MTRITKKSIVFVLITLLVITTFPIQAIAWSNIENPTMENEADDISEDIEYSNEDNEDDYMSILGDDGGGGAGDGGDGAGGDILDGGKAHVWFDRGGWKDSTSPGSGIEPVQGVYYKGQGINSTGITKMYNTFLGLLEDEINRQRAEKGKDAIEHWDGYLEDRTEAFKQAMVDACERAIARGGGDSTLGARVVGVAITWNEHELSPGTWHIGNDGEGKRTHYFTPMFNNNKGNAIEDGLRDSDGWGTFVNQTDWSDALEDETWREYILRIGAIDNQGVGGDSWNVFVVAVNDAQPPRSGDVKIFKSSSNPEVTNNNSCYSFEGAKFGIYRTMEDARNDANKIETLTANSNGETPKSRALPVGKYYVRELVAPKGYILPTGDTGIKEVTVEANETAEVTFSDIPNMDSIGILLNKKDKTTGGNVSQGDSFLKNAEYTVKYYDNMTASGTAVKTWVFRTDASGGIELNDTYKTSGPSLFFNELNKPAIPIGSITIQETKAPVGYLIDKTIYKVYFVEKNGVVKAYQDSAGTQSFGTINATNKTEDLSVASKEQIIQGGVKGTKFDSELDTNKPQGLATLKNAEITIYNKSDKAVQYGNKEIAVNGVVTTVKTNDKGEWSVDNLPYGTYQAKETKAPEEGYLINSTYLVDFQIRENEKVIDVNSAGDKITKPSDKSGWFNTTAVINASLEDQIIRADFDFFKIDIDGYKMANVPFLISRLDKDGKIVESHVIVTDEDGYINTKERSKTKVNTLDSYAVDGKFTDPSKLDATVNVWFGDNEAASKTAKLGSLIYGRYVIQELSCEGINDGQTMLRADLFGKNKAVKDVFTNGKVFHLENIMVDLNVILESDVIDDASQSKTISITERTSVTDEVRYIHLKVGTKYKLVTKLIYEDKEGNTSELGSNEKIITATAKDNTNTTYGKEYNTVTVDSSKLKGGKVHAIDELYAIIDGDEVYIGTHNMDMDIKEQTLEVPYMGTFARDGYTNDHQGTISENAKVIDTVKYEGFPENRTFVIEGTLRYADTGEAVIGLDGKPCVKEVKLTVSKKATEVTVKKDGSIVGPKSGEIEMPEFNFDASDLGNRTLVVTEVAYDYITDEPFIEHNDLNDENQSIHFTKVKTEAVDEKTGTQTGVVGKEEKIIDKITMENLIVGYEYTVKGILVYQSDWTDVNGVSHKQGDVIAKGEDITFTAENTTEIKYMEFTVDSTLLEGTSGVVEEHLFHKGPEVAFHKDWKDKKQTPNWPKVETNAWDEKTKSQHVLGGELENTIVDTVTLTNLTEGDTYKVVGALHKPDGSLFLIDGEEVTVESKVFTATEKNMDVEIKFTSKNGEFLNETIVVYEKLIHIGVETDPETGEETPKETPVASHEDPKDKKQTVKYEPKIGTTAKDKADGDSFILTEAGQIVVDTVSYEGLKPNTEYKMVLTVFDKTDNILTDITAEKVFTTSETGTGEVDVEVTIDGDKFVRHKLVMFEECFNIIPTVPNSPGESICEHKDPDDENQTIYVPDIETRLSVNGEKEVVESENTTLVDKVCYYNLKVGKTYTVTGELIRKEKGVTLGYGETTFVAKEENGSVDVVFKNIDTRTVAGESVVAFEAISIKEKGVDSIVLEHKDLASKEQTVNIKKKEPPKNDEPGIVPPTGDNTQYIMLVTTCVLTAMLICAVKVRKSLKNACNYRI